MRKLLYQLSDRFSLILFTLAILLIFILLYYSQSIVHDLRVQSRNIIEFYARVHSRAAMEEDATLVNFLFEEIIKRTNFPVILTDSNKMPDTWVGIGIDSNDRSPEMLKKVKKMVTRLEREIDPVPIKYTMPDGKEKVLGYLFYGDSHLITRLVWLPYVEIGVIGLFILVALMGFWSIKKSEERFIWVGLTKETAHQLGTPLSSMMGWMELMRAEQGEKDSILDEMENDLQRLSKVTARFSQIGSRAHLKKQPILPILRDAIRYFQRRLPHTGKEVKIVENFTESPEVAINRDLFEWVVENMIKNSLDAIEKKQGVIEISTGYVKGKTNRVYIDIRDNGKGIPAKTRRMVFKPGFSTKKRGWGLGLNLAKRIIEEFHGGRLIIKETKPGEGTTMRILLKG
ncbi:MAG: HAMP domain-containing histidine kinase [Calditrichaeota bacterium]|nr:HAMP domain-containing histidine kinase [Calditrichota bacterium]